MLRITLAALALVMTAIAASPAALDASAQRSRSISIRQDLYLYPLYDASRDPQKDLEAGLAQAAASNKRVLLDVGGDWCSWCHLLDNYLATQKETGDAFAASFVIVKINWSPEQENKAFLSRFPEASGYPHFYVLDVSGQLLVSQDTSKLERGDSYNKSKMLDFAKRWRAQ